MVHPILSIATVKRGVGERDRNRTREIERAKWSLQAQLGFRLSFQARCCSVMLPTCVQINIHCFVLTPSEA